MTPKRGSKWMELSLAAAGVSGMLACGGAAPRGERAALRDRVDAKDRPALISGPRPERPWTAAQDELAPAARVTRALERLERLEVVEVSAVASERTTHSWVPYGGFWHEHKVPMGAAEQAERLEGFVAAAEAAVARTTAASISESFHDEEGRPSLCTALGDETFCLSHELHARNLEAVNALEIVAVEDIVRSAPRAEVACYSSWATVDETECVRAIALEAIVDTMGGEE